MANTYISRVEDISRIGRSLKRFELPIRGHVTLSGLVIEGTRVLLEGSRIGAVSEAQMHKWTDELRGLLTRDQPKQADSSEKTTDSVQIVQQAVTSYIPVTSAPKDAPDFNAEKVEQEMLIMAGDMREVALNVKSTLQRDRGLLANTAELQDSNLDATMRENSSAKGVRSAKRLSFMMTILMIISSVVIFLALIPVILVT